MSILLSTVKQILDSPWGFCYAPVSTSKEEQSNLHPCPAPKYNGPAVIIQEKGWERGEGCDIWATTFDMESGQAKSCKKQEL